jgi:hypothetical protein
MRIGLAGGAIAVITGPRLCRADDGPVDSRPPSRSSICEYADRPTVKAFLTCVAAKAGFAVPIFTKYSCFKVR